ncbi:hypothetical protein KC865_04195 [Candidatus Kaiserbacteria bacterium]|nr:hypothetical protein [Candidatus Kaiserbacteria bacterium]USN92011.1 MAG: hypothetical protein H6782_03995 [Candidatus Nomurabacteria bacterium]
MKLDSGIRNIIILVFLVFTLTGFLIFWLTGRDAGKETPSVDIGVTFPQGGEREIVVNQSETLTMASEDDLKNNEGEGSQEGSLQTQSDWRDEVIELSQNGDDTLKGDTFISTGIESGSDSQDELEALFLASERLASLTPQQLDLSSIPGIPTIDTSDSLDCGRFVMPSTESATKETLKELEENETLKCMGKAIADNCTTAQIDIINLGFHGHAYVSALEDGSCGFGFTFGDEELVTFCGIESTMNASTGENRSFDEWREHFAKNPGELFASLYIDNPGPVEDESGAINCSFGQIKI